MIGFLIAVTFGFALVVTTYLATPAINEWLRERQVLRRSAIDQEMQAMRAAQQLSLLAWKARHQMYDVANDIGGHEFSQSTHSTTTRY